MSIWECYSPKVQIFFIASKESPWKVDQICHKCCLGDLVKYESYLRNKIKKVAKMSLKISQATFCTFWGETFSKSKIFLLHQKIALEKLINFVLIVVWVFSWSMKVIWGKKKKVVKMSLKISQATFWGETFSKSKNFLLHQKIALEKLINFVISVVWVFWWSMEVISEKKKKSCQNVA